ncbi:MAG: hypothetical protein LBD47_10410 [Treponema sp.]|jgi:ribose/xylose/arabinose/galactoside ABC-type transport system permease subunit|nr:hypothetical protein [Treponema sp.]
MSSLFFKERLHKLQRSAAFTGPALFLIVVVINVIVQGPFRVFTIRNIALVFTKNAPLILVTMGQLLLMLLGIIDISIGVQMALVNVAAVMLPTWFPAMPYPPAWAGAICIAGIHGLIAALLRIPPLLTSFCMIYIVRGINLLIMPKPQGSVPEIIYLTYDMNILGIPRFPGDYRRPLRVGLSCAYPEHRVPAFQLPAPASRPRPIGRIWFQTVSF